MPRKKKTTRKSAKPLKDLPLADLTQEIERRREGAVELAEERAELVERIAEIDEYLEELGVSTTTGRARGRPRKTAARSHSGGRKRIAKKSTKKKASKKTARKVAKKTTKTSKKKVTGKGPTKPRGSRKRHRNDTNLVGALQKVLSGKTLGVTEAANAVQKAGYKTTSPNFRTIVNQTLIKHPDTFSKKGRGLYTAK
ncbi:MAG: hypothetical protein NCW75_13605 [Phycisphaera sp.]|nr:MAG: hypothetical protein NCW75_13605 [Phycisphaera sp.]